MVIVAIPSIGKGGLNDDMSPRFGRCASFTFIELEKDEITAVKTVSNHAASAMGGAGVATYDDASCLYWNPGALSRVGRSQFMASHAEWLLGTDFNWVGLMVNMGGLGTVGVSFTQLPHCSQG